MRGSRMIALPHAPDCQMSERLLPVATVSVQDHGKDLRRHDPQTMEFREAPAWRPALRRHEPVLLTANASPAQ
jgi:hypothetical protein